MVYIGAVKMNDNDDLEARSIYKSGQDPIYLCT